MRRLFRACLEIPRLSAAIDWLPPERRMASSISIHWACFKVGKGPEKSMDSVRSGTGGAAAETDVFRLRRI